MGKRGITIEQLEAEFYERLAELVEESRELPLQARIAWVMQYTIYLVEVVKRWQTSGITPEKVVEKATQAMERRIRKQSREDGVAELRKLLEEDQNGRDGSGSERGDGTGENRASPSNGSLGGESSTWNGTAGSLDKVLLPRDLGKVPEGDRFALPDPPETVEASEGDSNLETDSSGSADNGPSGDGEGNKGEPLMQQKTCPKCGASLGPEISSPKEPGIYLATVKACPGCGWDPRVSLEDTKKPPKTPPKGPRPPKAGKAFSRG